VCLYEEYKEVSVRIDELLHHRVHVHLVLFGDLFVELMDDHQGEQKRLLADGALGNATERYTPRRTAWQMSVPSRQLQFTRIARDGVPGLDANAGALHDRLCGIRCALGKDSRSCRRAHSQKMRSNYCLIRPLAVYHATVRNRLRG
jgi:hypothetical protein